MPPDSAEGGASQVRAQALERLRIGRPAEAEELLGPWCEAHPKDAAGWFLLGVSRDLQARPEPALAALDRALALVPDLPEALAARASVRLRLGRTEEASGDCAAALAAAPGDPLLRVNAGVVAERLGDSVVALSHYEAALDLEPDFPAARMNRGLLLTRLGRLEEALENNRRLAARHPDLADAHANVAEACLPLERWTEAAQAAARALDRAPGHPRATLDRGLALAALGRLEEGQAALEEARRIEPELRGRSGDPLHGPLELHGDPFDARNVYLQARLRELRSGDWSRYEEAVAAFDGLVDQGWRQGRPIIDRSLAFPAMALPLAQATRRRLAEAVARRTRQGLAPRAWVATQRPRGERLRVGYLSPDFGEHPTGRAVTALFRHHDRDRFEVHAWSLGPDDGSGPRRRMEHEAEHFHDLHGLAPAEAAYTIYRAGCDVLVDLAGYTGNMPPELLAERPAPLQVGWFGYQHTLGPGMADYHFTDAFTSPPDRRGEWCEARVFLPETLFLFDPEQASLGPPVSRSALRLPEDAVVFCCFSPGWRIGPEVFGAWMRILDAVPDSVLWLLGGEARLEARLRAAAGRAGVAPGRLQFAPRRPREEHLARLGLADLFLDTLEFNAHTTAADALWAGVPVLTRAGTGTYARLGGSIVRAAGLADLVVGSLPEYEAQAVALARDPTRLFEVRRRLEAGRDRVALFDARGRVRALERALEMIHERRLAGEPPTDLVVPPEGHSPAVPRD